MSSVLVLAFIICIFVFVVIFYLVALFKILGYIYTYLFWGAINVPSTEEKVKQIINIVDLSGKKKAIDLGSGDGRIVIALAKAGIEAHGYEINPFLVARAKKNIKKAGLKNKAHVYLKNFWQENLGEFDVVVVFGMKHVMAKLEKKLEKELKPGAVVVLNYFTFSKWKPEKMEDDIYLYIKK